MDFSIMFTESGVGRNGGLLLKYVKNMWISGKSICFQRKAPVEKLVENVNNSK